MIYCPVCKEFGASRATCNGIQGDKRLSDIRKAGGKHLQTRHHLDTLEERAKELRYDLRRAKIGLNTARIFY
jgi:hypothetical protein